jgi:hypothetical protein
MEELRKFTKPPVRVVIVVAEVQTRHCLKANWKCNCFNQLLCICGIVNGGMI